LRRRILTLVAFGLTVMCPAFAWAQSSSSTRASKSPQSDLIGLAKKADSGSTESELRLGFAYLFGIGVEKDINESIRWYRMAANNGDPVTQNNLGYLYETARKKSRISWKRPTGICAPPYMVTPQLN
jgi:TPR repeat protein